MTVPADARLGLPLTCSAASTIWNFRILDYAPRLEALLAGSNPFPLVRAAHLLTQQTCHDVRARYAQKWRLTKLLSEQD
ncbi:MAG: hypothetical protein RKR03_17275 [Candidatus Competibacter sp.]|nr:hypothetical protein [Candidatus Competibacter sp.]